MDIDSLKDLLGTKIGFIIREMDIRFESLESKVDFILKQANESKGSATGKSGTWKSIAVTVSIVISIASFIAVCLLK